MNSQIRTSLLYIFSTTVLLGTGTLIVPSNENNETIINLEIDGINYRLIADQNRQIAIGDDSYSVRVAIQKTKALETSLLTFQYPPHLEFKHTEPSLGGHKWVADQQNTLIMIHERESIVLDDSVVTELLETYRSKGAEATAHDSTLECRGIILNGTTIVLKAQDAQITQEIYSFNHNDHGVVISIQYMLDDRGENKAQYDEIRELLSMTLILND